jgi:hypothetical protein
VRIEILQSAEEDLDLGRAFYDSQKSGLGEYFLDSLFSDIESLALYAGIHAIHFKHYHRLLSKRFPFPPEDERDGQVPEGLSGVVTLPGET